MSEFFDEVWGNAEWRIRFAPALGQSYYHCLYRMLDALQVPYYCIVTTAPSWAGYRCLDMYQRVHVINSVIPENEAWYVLGLCRAPLDRMDVAPDMWFKYKVFHSFGQRPVLDNWYLEPLRNGLPWVSELSQRIMLGLQPASTDAQGRRMPAMAGQVQSPQRVGMDERARL